MDRRRFLVLGGMALGAGATGIGLAGCTSGDEELMPGPSAPVPPSPGPAEDADPDAGLRAAVAATELALIADYRAAIEAFPRRAAELEVLLAQHEEHLARVVPSSVSAPAVGSPAPIVSPSGSGGPSPPVDRPPTLARLVAAETAARAQHITSCDAAADPALARDLCLMAGSEAQHAAVLRELRGREGDT